MLKRVLKVVGLVALGLVVLVGGYVGVQVARATASLARVYSVPVPAIARSGDPAVIARGQHLARSIAGCALHDCHGEDMGGGPTDQLGPAGMYAAPNATLASRAYTDGELARLVRHGLRRDGRTVRFMPSHEIYWLPDADVVAVISWLRTLPTVPRPSGPVQVGALGKLLDRRDVLPVDIARRIDHDAPREPVPAPAPTAAYGRFIARACSGCHGRTFSGGRIQGTPPSFPDPPNLTPHASGLASWTYADFERLSAQGVLEDGRRVDPVMPTEALANMDATERRALWEFLRALPPRPYGGR